MADGQTQATVGLTTPQAPSFRVDINRAVRSAGGAINLSKPNEMSFQTAGGGAGSPFIQPYPDTQTYAKDVILGRKGSLGFNASTGEIDAYTRNQLITIYAQEIYGGGGAGSNVSDDIQGILDQIKSEQEVQGIVDQIKNEQTQKAIDDIKQDAQRIYGPSFETGASNPLNTPNPR